MAPTFASAAAGNNANSSRQENGSEWSRRTNGATQTFRRTSQAANSLPRDTTSHQPRNSTEGMPAYIPPHASGLRNGSGIDTRHSKDSLLSTYKDQQRALEHLGDIVDLFVGGWHPGSTNGTISTAWGRRSDHAEAHSVDMCWDRHANMIPLGLQDLTAEEKDLFSSTVNSPVKPPTQTNKEALPKDGGSHRKSSISQTLASPSVLGLSSPTQARPGNRRRDTGDAFPFPSNSLASPGGMSRYSRDEMGAQQPPAALVRRRTEQKDVFPGIADDRNGDKSESLGGLKRSITTGLGVTGTTNWGVAGGNPSVAPMGAFGSFALASNSTQSPVSEKSRGGALGSSRGQSRFANLMKGSSEDKGDIKDKSSINTMFRSNEADQNPSAWMDARQNRLYPTESVTYLGDEKPSGSAALGGGLDISPSRQRGFELGSDGPLPHVGLNSDSGRGMTGDHFDQHATHERNGSQEAMSPTNTNPYQSPENEKRSLDELRHDSDDVHSVHLPGLGSYRPALNQGLPGLGGLHGPNRLNTSFEASDRSQTPSSGPARGFPNLSGLGAFGGIAGNSPWSAGPDSIGTPVRERSAFGGPFGSGIMSSAADMHSPILAGLGNSSGFPGAPGPGFGSTRSKIGALFPNPMQEAMRMADLQCSGDDIGGPDSFHRPRLGFESIPRSSMTGSVSSSALPLRDTDSPIRGPQGMFDDLIATPRNERPPSAIGESASSAFAHQPGGNMQTSLSSGSSSEALNLGRRPQSVVQRQPSNITSPTSSQPPVAQMRTMVMPDRMRWIYKDPQGSTQGPWSGLEMHDWYRAGFFTPELLIKRLEDPEFEPLAQLIRRIGNSREPFLVPQIGVPHEPQSANQAAAGAPTGSQPPFPNSFPSFGTTLTAEQQNALERRKQEEQFLMARQKEHLAQQQLFIKQSIGAPGQGAGLSNSQLHHHSSAHSLHSQQSFGSIASPAGYQPSSIPGPKANTGFFDLQYRQVPGASGNGPPSLEMLGNLREQELPGMLERMALNRQQLSGQLPIGQNLPDEMHAQQIASVLQDRANLQREQAEHDRRNVGLIQESRSAAVAHDRLQHFQDLHSNAEFLSHSVDMAKQHESEAGLPDGSLGAGPAEETLTQQVQAASVAKANEMSVRNSPWNKTDIPGQGQRPPQSTSPIPAPVAQRKQNVADNLVAEARSRSQSPAVETPSASVAPWAEQASMAPKTMSLKEIQEAEAARRAQQEAIAAAERRAVMEREIAAAQSTPVLPPAPGLPAGVSWATASPATPTSASAPWAAKTSSKPNGKTLQQIQKEEEAKKVRAANAAAAAAAAAVSVPNIAIPVAGGKRYADLAGKTIPSPITTVQGGPWTTVGASGKVKPLVSSPALPGRAISGNVAALSSSSKPSPSARSTTMGTAQIQKLGRGDALGEFKKWALAELQRGHLDSGLNSNDFVETLIAIGSDTSIITEAVHDQAPMLDSRHFAEEFIRRKKQADKGIIEPSTSASPSSAGWSAVAKKGQTPTPSSPDAGFKVAKAKRGKR